MEPTREVVAAAIIENGRLLLAQRTHPPELAGKWELPGGKVEDGESPAEALSRELTEELGITVTAGERIGVDVELGRGLVLRAYEAFLVGGTPEAVEHSAVSWVGPDDLGHVDLVPNDRLWLADLEKLLRN